MGELKKILYDELEIKNAVSVEGLSADPHIFKHLDLGGEYQEQVHTLFEMDHEHHGSFAFPCGFESPHGFHVRFKWDNRSPYGLTYDDGVYHLRDRGEIVFAVEKFDRRPKYYQLNTSDGTPMKTVATYSHGGSISTAYSNECALKEKGLDCLFCNANATRDAYAEKEGINWKNPKQIGETVAAAYKEGGRHFNLTGGFVPERREVDYYLDVAESIREHTGLEDFNGTAVIGAPKDLKIIDKYKEAGFRTIAIQIEVWDKNYFKTICPGKIEYCGSWEHWIEALEYAVTVFGHGRVRTGIVGGLEPKLKTLEGLEHFASKGIVCLAGAWCPNPGSALEGHRTPTPEWHFDLAKKAVVFYRKAGFTFDQLFDASPSSNFVWHDIYRIEDELLPAFKSKAA